MAVLGKRKAPETTISDQDAQEIFRRHFEARFNPLPAEELKSGEEEEEEVVGDEDDGLLDSDEEGPAWGGLSDDEDVDEDEDETPTVEVVDHSVSKPSGSTTMSKRELKAFMSSLPPDQTSSNKSTTSSLRPSTSSSSAALPEDAPSLLAQDLELRRLLAESHLLAGPPRSFSSSSSSTTLLEPKSFTSGRIRQKATDLRIQALGSKASILKQEKMPMHMRKGIAAAATARETKRRREAKENGIILERDTSRNSSKKSRRGGGGGGGGGLDVGRPGVGRMKGAELRISERDVKRIEGTRDTFGRRGKR